MKKYILFIAIQLCFSFAVQAKPAFICSYVFSSKAIKNVEKIKYDKLKHCAVTCMLTLRCGASDALQLGVLKEIKDLFGYGNAEWADLEANQTGAYLGTIRRARSDQECITRCKDYYPDQK